MRIAFACRKRLRVSGSVVTGRTYRLQFVQLRIHVAQRGGRALACIGLAGYRTLC